MDATNAWTRSLNLAICGLLFCVGLSNTVFGQARSAPIHTYPTKNFVVYANNPDWARQVGDAAEAARKDLAMHWLGYELPQWSKPCPLVVRDHPTRPASGETKYTIVPEAGAVVNFNMTVEGTRERIIDSVLPHEITHTIVASHFAPLGDTIPRWADEGMCTTVEHEAERRKHDAMLIRFLREGKGISFETLFALKEYPSDILPLYAQGYSLTSFLIAQGGPQQFIRFLEHGMRGKDWNGALHATYGYPLKGKLQTAWNDWVAEGGGDVTRFTASARGFTGDDSNAVALASNNAPIRSNESSATLGSMADGSVRVASAIAPIAIAPNAITSSNAPSMIPANDPSRSPSMNFDSRSASVPRSSPGMKSDNFVPPSLGQMSARLSQESSSNLNEKGTLSGNSPMHPSGSYYIQQLQRHAESNRTNEDTPASGRYQHSVSQPGPLQTIGGGFIYR